MDAIIMKVNNVLQKEKKCRKCSEIRHFATVCYTKEVTKADEENDDYVFGVS